MQLACLLNAHSSTDDLGGCKASEMPFHLWRTHPAVYSLARSLLPSFLPPLIVSSNKINDNVTRAAKGEEAERPAGRTTAGRRKQQ